MDIEVKTPITAEAEVLRYALVSDDIFLKRYDYTTVPDWYKDLIEDLITNSPSILDGRGLQAYLMSLQQGYKQAIISLKDKDSQIEAVLTTLGNQLNDAIAGIAEIWLTKVDDTSATAIVTTIVGAAFGPGGLSAAWFEGKISAYASAIEAIASNVAVLIATLNGVTVRIDTIDTVMVDLEGWSASSSKLITAPDGSITGWRFADGSNINSSFNIYADTFTISDGSTGYTPFSIVGNDIQFNGTLAVNKLTSAVHIGSYDAAPTDINLTTEGLQVTLNGKAYNVKDGDTYLNTTNGIMYFRTGTTWNSTAGSDGTNGTGQFLSLVFRRSCIQPAMPTGGSFSSPIPLEWSDGIPPEDGRPCWICSRLFTSDGLSPQALDWTTPAKMVDTSSQKYIYSTSDVMPALSGTAASNPAPIGWTSIPEVNSIWTAISVMANGVWDSWYPYKIKGEAGATGATGRRGSISATATYLTLNPTDAQLAATINAISGGPQWSIVGDNVIYTVAGVGGGTKTAYCIADGSVGVWVKNVAFYVNGNAIIAGSLNVDTISPGAPINGHTGWLSAIAATATASSNAGVSGIGPNAGVAGESTTAGGFGVYGYGLVNGNIGVKGESGTNHGVVGTSISNRGISGDSSSGYGCYGGSINTVGVVGVTASSSSYGIYTPNRTYSGGGYLPFTGSHIMYGIGEFVVGDIVEVVDSWVINISQSYTQVTKSIMASSKKVVGVVNSAYTDVLNNIRNNPLFLDDNGNYYAEYLPFIDNLIANNYKEVVVNALGDGAINVCATNGNISIGDYICSSGVPGKGMKQDDDILHNYTVAKSLENVDWANEADTTKMISCTYHCG